MNKILVKLLTHGLRIFVNKIKVLTQLKLRKREKEIQSFGNKKKGKI